MYALLGVPLFGSMCVLLHLRVSGFRVITQSESRHNNNKLNCITVNFDRTQQGISTIQNFIISITNNYNLYLETPSYKLVKLLIIIQVVFISRQMFLIDSA